MAVVAWSNAVRKDIADATRQLHLLPVWEHDAVETLRLAAKVTRLVCALSLRVSGMPPWTRIASELSALERWWCLVESPSSKEARELRQSLERLDALLDADDEDDGVAAIRMLLAVEGRFESVAAACCDLLLAMARWLRDGNNNEDTRDAAVQAWFQAGAEALIASAFMR